MTDAEYVTLQKSTIVRSSEPPLMPLARAGNRALSRLAPSLAAALGERLFLAPPRGRRPAIEIDLLGRARARSLRVGGRRVETWAWGTGPSVLLVHGWGGRGAQLGAFVDPLVAHGFSVVTFDAPGHGASDRGRVTLPEMTATIREVASTAGPIAGLIAHSAGAVAATRALYEGLSVDAAVYIAPASDLEGAALRFSETYGFSRAVRERMQRQIETESGVPWAAFDLRVLARSLATPLFVIHDRGDAHVPWQHGMAITSAWPGAAMLTTDGLGHHRILRAPAVAAAAVAFIATATLAQPVSPGNRRAVVEPPAALAY